MKKCNKIERNGVSNIKEKLKLTTLGFTLVELLAVIVILAIILVIAVPKVMNVIEDSKKATLESTAKMIASEAEKQKVQNTVLGKTDEITCDSVAKINDVDYASCDITFENNTAKVTIEGSGKFEGLYVCKGDKITAEATSDECILKGDANNDGILDMYDSKYVNDMVVSNFKGLTDDEMAALIKRADMNGDGYVSAKDASAISTLVINSGWVFEYANPHSYNGAELPELPEWDKQIYPNAIIRLNNRFQRYYLLVLTSEPVVDGTTLSASDEKQQYIQYDLDDEYTGTWITDDYVEDFSNINLSNNTLIWTNIDILNKDGSLYLGATEPTPVSK